MLPVKKSLIAEMGSMVVEPKKSDAKNKKINTKTRTGNKNALPFEPELFEDFGVYDFCEVLITFIPSVVGFILE